MLTRLRFFYFLLAVVAGCSSEPRSGGFSPDPTMPAGRRIYGVDRNNRLIALGSANPAILTRSVPITRLQPGEFMLGIDFRPLDGRLYALGSSNRVYLVDTLTGSATPVGLGPLATPLTGSAFGFDFNPVPDRIRVHSDADQNLRVRPDSGTLAAVDSTLMFDLADANAFDDPNLVGTAYTNSVAGATTTTLYAIDSQQDLLVLVPNPNDGRLTTRGPLGVNTTSDVGFDIAGDDGTAYASLTPSPGGLSRLYLVNLSTGTTRLVGQIGNGLPIVGIAIAP
jgi:hypothetical protein